jgi:site-specific DNA-adenine methylase
MSGQTKMYYLMRHEESEGRQRVDIIQFNSLFIYVLNSTANGQLQSQHEYKQPDKTNKKTKQRNMDHLRLFKLKHDLLKISVDLQTAFAADTHLAEGQWLNVIKLRMF